MPPRSGPRKPPSAAVPVQPPKSKSSSTSSAIPDLWNAYLTSTSPRLKLIDSFLLFTMLSGMACFAYCILITDFPLNAFLGAFASCVGQFVLLASLRSQ
ncbi:MAG: oligosaccharyltransferase complex subunit epsilon, partial [Cyphobasidiales sp. Tagirdzhanova-0007]